MVMLTFMLYGLEESQAAAVETRWTELVRSAVGARPAARSLPNFNI
jgi:hypothetical protein